MFIVPHGAPGGYEWFVALVVLVGFFFAVCSFVRNVKPLDGFRRERQGLPAPNPIRPSPGPEHRLRELQRRFRSVGASKRSSDFSRLCESLKDAPPKEQASRLHEHFGIVGGARHSAGRGRNKRP